MSLKFVRYRANYRQAYIKEKDVAHVRSVSLDVLGDCAQPFSILFDFAVELALDIGFHLEHLFDDSLNASKTTIVVLLFLHLCHGVFFHRLQAISHSFRPRTPKSAALGADEKILSNREGRTRIRYRMSVFLAHAYDNTLSVLRSTSLSLSLSPMSDAWTFSISTQ